MFYVTNAARSPLLPSHSCGISTCSRQSLPHTGHRSCSDVQNEKEGQRKDEVLLFLPFVRIRSLSKSDLDRRPPEATPRQFRPARSSARNQLPSFRSTGGHSQSRVLHPPQPTLPYFSFSRSNRMSAPQWAKRIHAPPPTIPGQLLSHSDQAASDKLISLKEHLGKLCGFDDDR